ncbi:unnamed protein product [Cercospora beticola]|nr:unnamed protein product [Cercospora beticola]
MAGNAEKVPAAYNDADRTNKCFVLNALRNFESHLGYEAFQAQNWTTCEKCDAGNQRHEQYLVPLRGVVVEEERLQKGEKVLRVRSQQYAGAVAWSRSGRKPQENCTNAMARMVRSTPS